MPSQTYGEQLIEKLLKSLPPNLYFWYPEPTITTNGKSSRQNPDFVIVNARHGVTILEVKDWTTIKSITQRDIEIVRRDGTSAIEQNPVNIAKDYAHNLTNLFRERAELLHKGGRHAGKLNFPWRFAAILPNISRRIVQDAETKGIWERGIVLSKDDLTPARFETALENIPGAWSLDRPLNNDILDVIRGVIDPRLIVNNSDGEDVGTVTQRQENEIYKDLATDRSIRLLRGVAGSGKSLVLSRRAEYLAEQNPDLSILVMAYNVDLAKDLQKRTRAAQNTEVTNFHKVCKYILGEKWHSPGKVKDWLYNRNTPLINQMQLSLDFVADEVAYRKDLDIYDGKQYLEMERSGRGQALTRAKREIINQIFDEYIQYQRKTNFIDWDDVPRLAAEELQSGHPLQHHYDVILIDEVQDFAPSWLKVVMALLKPDGDLFMCDDPTQSIFRFTTWKQKGVEVVGHTRVLRIPFRSTQAITLAAHSLIKIDPVMSQSTEIPQPDLTSRDLQFGDTPTLVNCLDLQQEIEFVKQKTSSLIQSGIPAKNIAILCHNKSLVRYWENLHNQGVYVESFWKMKGLEFQIVLLPHLQTAFEYANDESGISEVRRRIFTAMTRARETLIMSYYDTFPPALSAIEPFVQAESIRSN